MFVGGGGRACVLQKRRLARGGVARPFLAHSPPHPVRPTPLPHTPTTGVNLGLMLESHYPRFALSLSLVYQFAFSMILMNLLVGIMSGSMARVRVCPRAGVTSGGAGRL